MTRRSQRIALVLAVLVAGDCVEGPTGPGSQDPARVRIEMVLPAGTPDAWRPAGDTLRVLIRRAGRVEPIVDTARVTDSLVATVTVPLDQAVERFVATAELVYGGQVLFLAFEAVQLRAALDTAVALQAVYVGPAGSAAALTVAAADSALEVGDTTTVVPTALDSLGQSLGRVPVRFLVPRPDLFTVDAEGHVTALDGVPDTTRVDVVMPTGLTASLPLRLINAIGPFNQTVAFISTRDGNRELYVMDADGSNARRLTTTPDPESFPSWAPDQSAIVFERLVGDAREIFTLRLSDSTERQLTANGFNNSHPRFSPDGTRIAWTLAGEGAEVWVMDPDGANPRRMPDPFGDGSALAFGDWAPDGRRVALLRFATSVGAWSEAWSVDTAGGDPRMLVGAGEGSVPNLTAARWSPLGGQLVLTHQADGDSLVFAVTAGEGVSLVDINHSPTFDGNPAYAGAGDVFVFESEDNGIHGIYRMTATGSPMRLTPATVEDFEPDHVAPVQPIYVDRLVISPATPALTSDEASQVFGVQAFDVDDAVVPNVPVDWRAEGSDVMVIADTVWGLGTGSAQVVATYGGWRTDTVLVTITSAAGSNAQRMIVARNTGLQSMRGDGGDTVLLVAQPFAREPAYRADATRLAFSSFETGNGEIFAVNPDGSQLVNLTNHPADDLQPAWSPDGSQLVFSSTRSGGAARYYDLWIMNADGSGARRLTFWADVNAEAVDAAWSPDGSAILYVRYIRGSTNPELWVLSPDGLRHEEFVLPQTMGYRWPAWTPDGMAVVFTRTDHSTGFIQYFGIGRAPFVTGASETVLSTGASPRFSSGGDFFPSVADDGLIAFNRAGRPFVMRPDGTGQSGLTGLGNWPRWQPGAVRPWVFSVAIGGDVATPIAISDTRQLTGTALDQNGLPIVPTGGFQWRSLDPAVAQVDGATGLVTGVASGTAEIALSSGLATPDTITVVVGDVVAPVTRTWVGGAVAGPTDWFVAANWSPAGVPDAADSVIIESTASPPVLLASTTVARLCLRGPLILNGHRLNVSGEFRTETGGPQEFTCAAAMAPAGTAGSVTMQQPGDTLVVGGDAEFQGGPTSGLMTDGVLFVAGNLAQRNADTDASFQASGNHRTVLNGTGPQLVVPEGSVRFGHLEIANSGGGVQVFFETTLEIEGSLTISTATTFDARDNQLDVEGTVAAVAGSTLRTVGLRVFGVLDIGGGYEVGFTEFAGDDQDIPALPYQNVGVSESARLAATVAVAGSLHITGGSSGSSLTVNGHTLTVGNLRTGGGGADPAALVMQNPNDVVVVTDFALFDGDSASTNMTDGVLYIAGDVLDGGEDNATGWPLAASGAHRTVLNGSVLQRIVIENREPRFHHLEIANTGPGVDLPLRGEGVEFAVGGMLVVSTPVPLTGDDASITVGDSIVTVAGSSVSLNNLELRGGIDVNGALQVQSAHFAGTGQDIPPQAILQNVQVSGTARLVGSMSFPGFVFVREDGADLSLNGHRLDVGTFSVGGVGFPTGTLTMTDPGDTLVVQDVAFAGAPGAGRLTAGTLIVMGDFHQNGTAAAFQPSGTHQTVLTGAGVVRMADPGTTGQASWFNRLVVGGTAGSLFQLSATVLGELELVGTMSVQPGVLIDVVGHLLLRAGSTLTNDGTVQYGTFTNEGATINGNAPVQRP